MIELKQSKQRYNSLKQILTNFRKKIESLSVIIVWTLYSVFQQGSLKSVYGNLASNNTQLQLHLYEKLATPALVKELKKKSFQTLLEFELKAPFNQSTMVCVQ